jgi:hypothetical protein
MNGSDLQSIYKSVLMICLHYINVLRTKGISIEDEDLSGMLRESSPMSKSFTEYGGRKSTSVTAVLRLSK